MLFHTRFMFFMLDELKFQVCFVEFSFGISHVRYENYQYSTFLKLCNLT